MKPRTLLFLWLAVLTVLRWFYLGQVELSGDEAYYKMWADRPDMAYYSKGPGVAATIWLSTALFGDSEFGIRFFSPLLSLGTSLILFFLSRRLFDESIAIWTVLAASTIPIFQVGGLLMTIDPLSIFFWTAALASFWAAISRAPRFSLFWPLTGALMGLGFLCKYTNVAQLISIVLLLALTRRLRGEFLRPGFWSMLVVFSLSSIPPILWNAQREWITVSHLQARGSLDTVRSLNPGDLLEFIGVHFGVYSPLVFLGLMIALVWGWKKAHTDFTARFLLVFALPLLAFYCLLSLRAAGEANWTAPAFVSLLILSTALWHRRAAESRAARGFAIAAVAVAALMSLVVINMDILRRAGVPLSYDLDPSDRLRGWKTSAEQVQKIRNRVERETGKPVFLIANSYQTASILSYYLPEKPVERPDHPPVYIPESQAIENQFSFWPGYDQFIATEKKDVAEDAYYTEEDGVNPFIGRNALYITDRAESKPASSVSRGFRDTEMIALIEIRRRGLPLRIVRIFACYNYQTLPL